MNNHLSQAPAETPTPVRPWTKPAIGEVDFAPAAHAVEDHNPPDLELPLNDYGDQELARLTEPSTVARIVRQFFSLSPAWIVSMLLHFILLMVLGLIVLNQNLRVPDDIVLSVALSTDRAMGDGMKIESAPRPSTKTTTETPKDVSPDTSAEESLKPDSSAANARRSRDAKQNKVESDLQTAADTLTAGHLSENAYQRLPPLDSVRTAIDQAVQRRAEQFASQSFGAPAAFAARDPRLREEILASAGGTLLTEAAVARGLRWLASVQNTDGSWSLKNYDRHANPNNKGDCMATGQALLPFLGAGQTHEFGIYQTNVARGLSWMIQNQLPNGDLRAGLRTEAGMYAHGQGAIVLCEVLAMTGDVQFRDPAQRAIEFIENAQAKDGGWRYRPGQKGDTSVLGWQMMALQSAAAAKMNLEINSQAFTNAGRFLDSVSVKSRTGFTARAPYGTFYSYQKGRQPTETMTAEAILCRMYLGWNRNDPRTAAAIDWLMKYNLPSKRKMNVYYWYYGSQVMHHYGGRQWERWNQRVQELLLESQESGGRNAGSWSHKQFRWGPQGGRIYTTAMSICTLEVYYRHLPLYQKIELDEIKDVNF